MIETIIGAVLGNLLFVFILLFIAGYFAYGNDTDETSGFIILLTMITAPLALFLAHGSQLMAFGVVIAGWKVGLAYLAIASIIAIIQMRVYDIDNITDKAVINFDGLSKYHSFSYRWVAGISRNQEGQINIRIWWFGLMGYFIQYVVFAPILVLEWFIGDVVKKVFLRLANHMRQILIDRITAAISVKLNK